ncbi:hypothetical protein LCGC14_0375050 [marine sediment metagenome]|uniref:Uncharacterized protein n=1 Tax=marine sediment metagenome TaxID=412755 RepID=A0A0F9WCM6_9ZZZZ
MSSKEATYRAQLGEALVQIVDLQVELQACQDQPVHVESRATETLEKCREANEGLAKQALDRGVKIEELEKEIAELAAVRIKQSDRIGELLEELTEAGTQIKFLQKQIKEQA